MNGNVQRGVAFVLTMILLIMTLAGCGNFRRQAVEAGDQLDDVLQRLDVAEDAAARNAAQILELQHRIETLEMEASTLEDSVNESNTSN